MTTKSSQITPGTKLRDAEKMAHIPIKVMTSERETMLRKPNWLRIKLPKSSERIDSIKAALRKHNLHSVCEEASCPNLSECFNNGTATFMILGDICTRRCPFCDVGHGRPMAVNKEEPRKLALTLKDMKLKYVVITSVDRDDLRDGGAQQFVDCITEIAEHSPHTKVEILVPDFRGRMDRALEILNTHPPGTFNHNLETAPRLYTKARPGANYQWSLDLLKKFGEANPSVPTKSGLMVGLGETNEEILQVMRDLRAHGVTMLTIGQYLQPSKHHLPVERYVHPDDFAMFKREADKMGFDHAACGPLVRSSYHADKQAAGEEVK
ncbi:MULTISPECIES: lipoyl synthase [unclassified Colwellia]|jgi:lipoic acid synthetase|uniref:lipoyl synthase n=1 Tax=unclassified Colwellia TaxID=196834 RepID=UPI0015F692BE|nr:MULTISPECIES: lipoyl synthase [unclassified Colwellia]MBA6224484.1 lipoyl synthase [Colwellia sp. MB3u-45]MBA6267646.1 lipoyl synthase [Colwellia sp. MB3u-43]MBA6288636.1 lipoyl synthase [Colwellia sp. MB3u-4]MBA6292617.1 lipoyl synthase [Colwellia sp. MB3u-8]MBA6294916.1 lipoyl synthase [Colwellia sp. MB02u-9]